LAWLEFRRVLFRSLE